MSWVPRNATTLSFSEQPGKKATEHPLMEELLVGQAFGSKSAGVGAGSSISKSGLGSTAPLSGDFASQQHVLKCEQPIPVRERNPTALNRNEVRRHVLMTYTSNVPIVSLVAEEGDQLTDEQRLNMKLSQIDTDSAAKANQLDLIRHIEGLDTELKQYWSRGEKVRGLRIAIQATKLLNNPRAPHCYPSIFVLVSAVLDTFGNFVADRLQETAAGKSVVIASLLKRGQEAGSDVIPSEAVEMCSNWFLKIASIRELLPRICIELSLIKCYKYVAKKVRVNMATTVERLAMQIRGVADPLVSNHVRWYLFLRAAEVLKQPHWASVLEQCAIDAFTVLDQLQGPVFEATLRDRGLSRHEYLALFMPALQWMLDTVIRHGDPARRLDFIRRVFEQALKSCKSAALLTPLLRTIPAADLVALTTPHELLGQIVGVTPVLHNGLTYLRMVEDLALALGEIRDTTQLPLSRTERLDLLKEMWGFVERDADGDVNKFVSASGAILQFCATHLGLKQVNLILGAARKQLEVSSSEANDAVLSLLGGIITRLDISSLLTSSHFLPLVKYLRPDSRRQLTVAILDLVPKDPAYGAAALELCKTLHGVLPPDAEPAEQERCGRAICNALRRVFNPDPEAELRLLCDARHSLTEIDAVKTVVVSEAIKLVHLFGTNSRKRQAAKGCLAFCHVSIPAIMRPLARLRAALLPAAVAFQYGFVAQGEALLHLSINTLKEVPPTFTDVTGQLVSNDLEIIETVLQLVSIAAVVPSHAKFGHAYVASAVLAWNHTFPWLSSSVGRVSIYAAILRSMSRAAKGELQYAFVKCGTGMYSSDPDFVAACIAIATEAAMSGVEVLEAMLTEHQADSTKHPRIAQMAVELFETCCYFGDVHGDEEGAEVVINAARLTFNIMSNCVDGTDIPFVRRVRNIAESSKEILGADVFSRLSRPPKKLKRRAGAGGGGGAAEVAELMLAAAEGDGSRARAGPPTSAVAAVAQVPVAEESADALLDAIEGGGNDARADGVDAALAELEASEAPAEQAVDPDEL